MCSSAVLSVQCDVARLTSHHILHTAGWVLTLDWPDMIRCHYPPALLPIVFLPTEEWSNSELAGKKANGPVIVLVTPTINIGQTASRSLCLPLES